MNKFIDFFLNLSLFKSMLVRVFLGALGSATVIGILSEFATYSYAYKYGLRLPLEGFSYLSLTISTFSFLMFMLSFGIILFISTFFSIVDLKKYLPLIQIVFVITIFITITLVLFNQNMYGGFLKSIGYGGGFPIFVNHDCSGKGKDCKEDQNAFLILRTNNSIIIYKAPTNTMGQGRISEIPLSSVKKLSYFKLRNKNILPNLENNN